MNADPFEATISSSSSLKNIEKMMDEISAIQNDFIKREVQEMVEKFQDILQDLFISQHKRRN